MMAHSRLIGGFSVIWEKPVIFRGKSLLLLEGQRLNSDLEEIVLGPDGKLLAARSRGEILNGLVSAELRDAFDENGGFLVDLDQPLKLLKLRARSLERDDIDAILTAWNLLEDVAVAVGKPLNFHGKIANCAYEKLFWGMNPPYWTPIGEVFTPAWNRKEILKMRQIIQTGRHRLETGLQDGLR